MNAKYFKYAFRLLAILTIAFYAGSCVDDNFELDKLSTHTENRSHWNLPMVNTSFTIEELLNQFDTTAYVDTDTNGLIIISYADTAYSAVAEDVIEFPNQLYDTIFNQQDYQNEGGFSGGSVTMRKEEVDYLFATIGTQLLDSIKVKSSGLKIDVRSSFQHTGTLTITFPELKKNGEPYQKVINIDDHTGGFNTIETYNDLNGYMLDFTQFEEALNNTFFITYELTLNDEGSGTVASDAECNIEVEFVDIKYDHVWGYVGHQTISIPEKELSVEFFNSFEYGEFQLRDPRLKVKINNSFSLPVDFYTDTLQLRVGEDDVWTNITGSDVPTAASPWSLPIPPDNYPEPLQTADTTVMLSGTGTNIDQLITQLPDKMRFSEKAEINPEQTQERNNYIAHDSRIDAIMELEIPLWGRTDGLDYTDTMEMDLGDIAENTEDLEYIDLNLEIGNGLPHSIGFKGYLMDSVYNIVDSIPNTNDTDPDENPWWLVRSGEITGNDSIINQNTGKTISQKTIRYEGEGVDSVDNVKYMKIRAVFKTTDGDPRPYVKYYDFYGMDFKVSVDVKLNINENL